MKKIFVDRERELNRISSNFERTKSGEGRVVLLEGPAGIGKSAIVEKFRSELKGVEILYARASVDARFSPFHLFKEALKDYGDLRSIKIEQEKRKIKELSEDLVVRPRMIFVDEIENGAGYLIFKEMQKELKGLCLTVRMPEEGGVWLTETKTEKKKVNPSNLEFEVTPRIYDFLKEDGEKVIYIDNINYLIYLDDIERVVEFLHSLYSMSGGKHAVVISGRSEHLTEEEKSKLFSCFDEILSFEISRTRKKSSLILVDSIDDVESKKKVVFSSRRDGGKYIIGESPLDPHRLDFEIFETVSGEIMKGNDVVLDCISYLVHYNGIRKIYTWMKAIADFADKYGTRVFVVTKALNDLYVDMLKELADESKIMKHIKYEEVKEVNAIKFYDSILGFLDYNSKKKTIVMILEDLQWADKSSLELFRYLARNIAKSRIFILATYRGEDIVCDEEAAEIIEDVQSLENVDLMRVRGLNRENLFVLLKSKDTYLKEEKAGEIYEKSEGNPLLALSILEHFNRGNLQVPETIRESVEMQLESLDDRTLNFLWIVSSIGEYAPVKIVESVYPRWEERVKKVDGKFVEYDDGGIKFKYSIYREIIYQSASKDVRVDIHRKLGKIYEKKNVVMAAKHYYLAKDLKALKLLKNAAEESLKNLAIRDAIEYYKMALTIAEKYRLQNEIIEIYEHLGDFYRISGGYQKAIENYESSLKSGNHRSVAVGIKIGECYERLGFYDKALLIFSQYKEKAKGLEKGILAGKIGIVKWHLGDFDEGKQYLEEYLKIAKKYKSAEDEAEAYRNLAIIYYYYSKYDIAIEHAKKALDKAIESGKYDLIANSYNVIGVIYNRQNLMDDALEYFKKYLEIAEKIGNYDYISKAYNNLAIIYDYKGDYEKAKNYYLLSLEMNYKVGNKRDLAISYNNLAVVESESGDSIQAIEYLKKSYKYAEAVGDTYNMCSAYINLGTFYFQIRYYDDARRCFNNALKISKSEGYLPEIVSIYSYLALMDIEEKDMKSAEKNLALAEKALKSTEDIYADMVVRDTKIDYYTSIGKIDDAENLLEEAIKIAEKLGDDEELAFLDGTRAKLRCERGDYNNATIYFEKVIDYFKKKNKKKWIAKYYRQYGECLEKFNKEEAKKYYQYAYTLYKSMNNQKWAEEVEKKLKKM